MNFQKWLQLGVLVLVIACGSFAYTAFGQVDSDQDGLIDSLEIQYGTDPNLADTDGDGYADKAEVDAGYSPRHGESVRLEDVDSDNDGLHDAFEIAFGTQVLNTDTDGDGYTDGTEIKNGFDPNQGGGAWLAKEIHVNTKTQRVYAMMDGVVYKEYIASTGKNDSTPKGEFKIGKKHDRAWSRSAKLWMPYWMPFSTHLYGFHELPEWPNGVKEGEDHLGLPVSGGCVRLGVGKAQELYEWTPEGTPVFIE
jgi:lipoprotein-anchoring transpeptidase ErfK/SrfK